MRKDGRTWTKKEPARKKSYRKLKDKIDRIEDSMRFIIEKFEELRERVETLEIDTWGKAQDEP